MILVIADDFTGAAEIAGIALEFGLKAEIQTDFVMNSSLDIIILDTNTRSKSVDEAVLVLEELLSKVMEYDIDFLYKKIDSVLRGHVVEELSVFLNYFPDRSVILAPTNPSQGRTISNGTYYIDDVPLHETVFSEDPESPVENSDIYSLMHAGVKDGIQVIDIKKTGDLSPAAGVIYVAEATSSEDLKLWAKKNDETIIAAGAAEFFETVLLSKLSLARKRLKKVKHDLNSRKRLFVCGSSLSRAIHIKDELFENNPQVVEVPEDQICSSIDATRARQISDEVVQHYETTNNVILFVNASQAFDDLPTHKIPKYLAYITFLIHRKIELEELFIEGGTTSSEVIRQIGWTRFRPDNQYGVGIVRMEVIGSSNIFITVKPGSYRWPVKLWQHLLNTSSLNTKS